MDLLKQNHIKYGLTMTLITIICLTLMEITGQNESFDKSPLATFFILIAPLIIWFLGIRAKKKSLKNKLSFKQGFIEGFKISLVYAIISPFIFLLYYLFVNPHILESVKDSYKLGNVSKNMVITVDMLSQFVGAIVFGTLYGAIISFYLKTTGKKTVIKKLILGLFILAILSISNSAYFPNILTPKDLSMTFEGTLPCADCEGIRANLTLQENPRTFKLSQIYLGRDSSFVQEGNWNTTTNSSNETIYVLTPTNTNDTKTYLLKVGDDKVTMLDSDMKIIDSKVNFTLTKKGQ